jgi:hypothetical protein
VIWLSLLPLGLVLAPVLPGLLPEHYTFDAQTIREFIDSGDRPTAFVIGEWYGNTAYLYILLGIESSAVGGSYVTYFVGWASVYVGLWLANGGGRPWLWLPAFAWHVVLLGFTCMHSKELHAMPALALLLALCGRRFSLPRLAAIALTVAVYSVYFRQYWALVAALAFGFIVVRRQTASPSRLVGGMALVYVLLFAAYHLGTGGYLTDFRARLTAERDIDLYSATAFRNRFVNDNLVSDVLNAADAFVRLTVPIPLLAARKLQHLAFAVWELLNVGVFAVLFARAWRRRDIDARTEFAAAWILAFSLTQAMFEPDYGTFFRHQTTLLPAFALFCINAGWPAWHGKSAAAGAGPAPSSRVGI